MLATWDPGAKEDFLFVETSLDDKHARRLTTDSVDNPNIIEDKRNVVDKLFSSDIGDIRLIRQLSKFLLITKL